MEAWPLWSLNPSSHEQPSETSHSGNSATVGGNIVNGGLVVASAQTNRSLTIVSPVSYEEGTVVTGGVLALAGTGALPSDSTVELTSAGNRATFHIGGLSATAATLGNLDGVANSSVVLGDRTMVLGAGNFRGTITGEGGALVKNGSVLLVIGNPGNSLSGGVTVNEGSAWSGRRGGSRHRGSHHRGQRSGRLRRRAAHYRQRRPCRR